MDFQDVTTHHLLSELAQRYQHFGFVGVPSDESDPPICHSAVKSIVDQLLVKFIVEPREITAMRTDGSGMDFDVEMEAPVATEDAAPILLEGLAHLFPEMLFAAYDQDNVGTVHCFTNPPLDEAESIERERLKCLRDALNAMDL